MIEEKKKPQIEILSPAGSYESFLAAIHAGADAVYAGGPRFGARAFADNFTEETLKQAIDYAPVSYTHLDVYKRQKEQCANCPHKAQCKAKIYKRVSRVTVSVKSHERAKQQRFMGTEEFRNLFKIRNGVCLLYTSSWYKNTY